MTTLTDFVESRAALAQLGASSLVETADGTQVFIWQEQNAAMPDVYDINVAIVDADGNIVPQNGMDFNGAGQHDRQRIALC